MGVTEREGMVHLCHVPMLAARKAEDFDFPDPRPESLHYAGRESGKGMGLTGVTEREGMIHLCHVLAEKRRISVCVGCGSQIHDQYIMRVAPDLEWHAGCLKCADCSQYLDESCTCYVRDGKTYCKRDYLR